MGNRASVDEAQKRLLQAKKTLQMAIQAASQITNATHVGGGGSGNRRNQSFGNDRYLDRADEAPYHSRNNTSGGNFYNGGNWRGSARGGRGGRGGGRGRGRGRGRN